MSVVEPPLALDRPRPSWYPVLTLMLLFACCGRGPAGSDTGDPPPPSAPGAENGIHLTDISKPAGLDRIVQVTGAPAVDYIIDSTGSGAAWLDYDGDGDPDLYLAQGATRENPQRGPPDVLLRNDGDADGDGVPAFSDVTARSGLGDTLWSFGVAVADYDNDGDPDIYLTNWGPNRLYRNNGDGTFTDLAAAAGLADKRWGVSAAWSDVDRDGDLDLYVTNYVEFDYSRYPARGERPVGGGAPCMWKNIEVFCGPRNLEPAADDFYRNDGDTDADGVPRFTAATRQAGLVPDEPYYGLAALFLDADNDGDDDLYVANDSVRNTYFVNAGDGTFEETAILSGLAYNEQGSEQASMGIAAADYDGDGRLDLAVTSFSHDHDTLYRSEGDGLFSDVSYPAGIGSPSFFPLAWGVVFADLDQDGWEDLMIANGHVYPQVDGREVGTTFRQRNSVYRNLGTGRFEEVGERAGPGLAILKSHRALVPVDLEGDGDLDFLVTNLNDPPDLLRNDGAPGHWLQVRLAGTRSNREGIGARVSLQAGGRKQLREIRQTASYASSTLPVAHFGLGPAKLVDRLEVRWPSGATTVLENVQPNQLLRIGEPSGP